MYFHMVTQLRGKVTNVFELINSSLVDGVNASDSAIPNKTSLHKIKKFQNKTKQNKLTLYYKYINKTIQHGVQIKYIGFYIHAILMCVIYLLH